MGVLVAGRAVAGGGGVEASRDRQLRVVAIRAGKVRVLAVERERRLGVRRELDLAREAHPFDRRVAAAAAGAEGRDVHRLVARHALRAVRRRIRRAAIVTAGAADVRVAIRQGQRRVALVEADHLLPAGDGVAALARAAELAAVRILVARGAARELEAGVAGGLTVAGLAGDGRVLAEERKGRLRVVEAGRRRLEGLPGVGGVAASAARAELALVRVGVARGAGRGLAEEGDRSARRPLVVAARAGRLRVLALERPAGGGVVDLFGGAARPADEARLLAEVLDVAAGARLSVEGRVQPLAAGDPRRERLVAAQALRVVDLLAARVTAAAALIVVELGVRARQGAGRELRLGAARQGHEGEHDGGPPTQGATDSRSARRRPRGARR